MGTLRAFWAWPDQTFMSPRRTFQSCGSSEMLSVATASARNSEAFSRIALHVETQHGELEQIPCQPIRRSQRKALPVETRRTAAHTRTTGSVAAARTIPNPTSKQALADSRRDGSSFPQLEQGQPSEVQQPGTRKIELVGLR